VVDDEFDKRNSSDNEWVFIAIKEEDPMPTDLASYINVEKSSAAQIEEKDESVIDIGCSHHMTGDKSKFLSMEKYDGGFLRFGDDKACIIHVR
jgi:hypothetical protein